MKLAPQAYLFLANAAASFAFVVPVRQWRPRTAVGARKTLPGLEEIDRRAALNTGAAAIGSIFVAPLVTFPSSAAAMSNPDPKKVFQPAAGSLSGVNIVITGANTGLGLESAVRLTKAGATVIVTARSDAKVDKCVQDVKTAASEGSTVPRVFGAKLDLADLTSVKSFPSRLNTVFKEGGIPPHVDVLLNNAGVMAIPERLETHDGFERTVGVNHFGHFALTSVLAPLLRAAPSGFRVVTVASEAHRFVTPANVADALANNLEPSPSYSAWGAYGLSKAANVLFTEELQRRILLDPDLHGSAVALHPGAVQTDLARYIVGGVDAADVRLSETAVPPTPGSLKKKILDAVILPIDVGANTQVWLAAALDVGGNRAAQPSGLYFDAMRPSSPNAAASDPELARRLWEVSELVTGTKLLD